MTRSTRTAALVAASAAVLAGAVGIGAAPASAAATGKTIFVSPHGSDHNSGTHARPLKSLVAAQKLARADAAKHDVTVELTSGTYTLKKPLTFTAADSGRAGHPVRWTAAPGATPVVSGGSPVKGWSMYDKSKNVYVANVPVGQDSRQLYVNGAAAPRAAMTISRSAVTATASGFTINDPSLDYLATLPEQNRIEVESQDSFTDRYTPVQSISGTTITMQQPAWANNNFGYDVVSRPFAGGTLLLENSYSFLQSGQWFLDPVQGRLFYRAPTGDKPKQDSFVLPRLQSLVQMAGAYGKPVHDISFSGIQFSYTTWLEPGTSIGYADQQNGTFIAKSYPQPAFGTCTSGCPQFEAARNEWEAIPAAVQVAAAHAISFSGNTFAHLGEVGLGLGMDPNANSSGVGYGVSKITVHHNLFTDLGGGGVVVGGVQPDAHHPTDPRMTIKNVTIDNNFVTGVAEDYKDMSGILSTYADHTVIDHNEVSNLAYDGIDVGWGWGANDAGGSQDYANRGLYAYQPIYTTPTTLKNTIVDDNLIHATKKVFHDGGSIYNLSADPGAQISRNYVYDNQHTVGLYMDEGSRYVTNSDNVVQDTGVWAFTNASSTNNTDDNVFRSNWYNSGVTQVATGEPHNNQLIDNVQVSGSNWPLAAQKVMYTAGILPGLRTFDGEAVSSPAGLQLSSGATTLAPGASTTVTASVVNFSAKKVRLADTPGLTEPVGWTVTPLTALPGSVGPNGTVVETWRVTAPGAVPSSGATVTLTDTLAAVQQQVSHSLTQQVNLTVANAT